MKEDLPLSSPSSDDPPLTRIVAACLEDVHERGDAALDDACARYPHLVETLQHAVSLVTELSRIVPVGIGRDGLFADRYRLEGRLGAGGMGTVFRAHDTRLDRPVALKQVRLDIVDVEEVRRRFEGEILAATRLEHPNVCRVYEGDVWEGVPYMVMELIEGETLHDRIRRLDRKPGGIDLVPYVANIARALQAVHDTGLLHRDVKPANIMIRADDEPVLLDFGLARHAGARDGLTQSGAAPGTFSYMSPEQLSPHGRTLDARTDVYSLGMVLYECLAGRRAFDGGSEFELKKRILEEPPVPVRSLEPRVALDLSVIVGKAIEKNRDDRYATAGDLAADLRRFLDHEPICARPSGVPLRLLRWAQRKPMVVTVLAVIGLGAVVSGYFALQVQTAQAALRETRVPVLLVEADECVRRADFDAALERIEAARAIAGPDDARLKLALADTRILQGFAVALEDSRNVNRLLFPKKDLDLLREARAGDLPAADKHYVDAVLAESVGDSILALQNAIVSDPGHRRALALLGNLALVAGRLDLAREVVYRRRSVSDGGADRVVFELFVTAIAGESVDAEDRIDRTTPEEQRRIDRWRPLVEMAATAAHEFDAMERASLVDREFSFIRQFTKTFVPLAATLSRGLAERDASDGGVVFRVTPALGRAVRKMLQEMAVFVLKGDVERYVRAMRTVHGTIGDGVFLYGAASTLLYTGHPRRAEEVFRATLALPSIVVSPGTVRLNLLEAQWQRWRAAADPTARAAARRDGLATIGELLDDPTVRADADVLYHVHRIASTHFRAPMLAAEIVASWSRHHPADARAKALAKRLREK